MFYLSLINKDKLTLIIVSKQSIRLHPIVLFTYIDNVNSLFPLFYEILNFEESNT